MANKQIVAVWGSPGAGTTVTAVKIARELANRKNNVVLVLCDDATPMVPVIVPSISKEKSLGELLTMPTLSGIAIFQHCIPVGRTLSLLGYQAGENELTYGDGDIKRARKLITLLRGTADYVVIDCFHQLLANILTAAAMELSDVVLRVTNADPKSFINMRSQRPHIAEERFHYDRHINIINNILPSQDPHPYEDALGGDAYELPHIDALKAQYDEGNLLESLSGREARQYEPVIRQITEEAILND